MAHRDMEQVRKEPENFDIGLNSVCKVKGFLKNLFFLIHPDMVQ